MKWNFECRGLANDYLHDRGTMKTISMLCREYSTDVIDRHAGDLTESRWR
jgi:hypothetical protein